MKTIIILAAAFMAGFTDGARAKGVGRPSDIVLFGDSLSDNGNGTYKLSGMKMPPSPPFFNGRFSNGPVWIEYVADKLRVPLTDRAFGGSTSHTLAAPGTKASAPAAAPPTGMAQSGTGNGSMPQGGPMGMGPAPTPMDKAVAMYLNGTKPTNKQLYVIWGGGNDIMQSGASVPAQEVVSALMGIVGTLYGAGARRIVLNPVFIPPGKGDKEEALLADINTKLKSAYLTYAKANKGHFVWYDIFTHFRSILAKPPANFHNATAPCISGGGPDPNAAPMVVCTDANEHVLFDSGHPTTAVHKLLGERFIGKVFGKRM